MDKKIIKQQVEDHNFETILNAIEEDIAIITRDFGILFENYKCQKRHGNNVGKKCYESYAKQSSICPTCPSEKVFNIGITATSRHQSFDKMAKKIMWEL